MAVTTACKHACICQMLVCMSTSRAHAQSELVSVRAENDVLRKELQDVHTQLLKRHGLATGQSPAGGVATQSDPALADAVAREAAEKIAQVQAEAGAAARKAAVQLAEAQRVHGSLREELEVLRGELHCRPTAAAHQYVAIVGSVLAFPRGIWCL